MADMDITRPTRPLLLCAALLASLDAAASCNFDGIDAALDNLIAADGIAGGAVIIGSAKGILHEAYVGSFVDRNNNTVAYDVDAKVPLASATKLLSGIRILQLAGHGFVDLDTPVSHYLPAPAFPWDASAAPLTLRQLFSHTAGYGNDENDVYINNPYGTLYDSVVAIASHPDVAPQNYLPAGSRFAYGGVAMQIGGEVAQMATAAQPSPYGGTESGDWQTDWQHDIGAPLCISSIDWQGIVATRNYRISGGAQSNLRDYARVLAMLLDDGVGNGTRVLGADAVATWKTSQTGNAVPGCSNGCVPIAAIFQTPAGGTYIDTQYSVGSWIEPLPENGGVSAAGKPVVSSIGKFGFAPWVDYASGTFGILMVYDTGNSSETDPNAASVNSHVAMQKIIADATAGVRAQVPAGGTCASMLVYDNLFADGMEATPRAPRCPGLATLPPAGASFPLQLLPR